MHTIECAQEVFAGKGGMAPVGCGQEDHTHAAQQQLRSLQLNCKLALVVVRHFMTVNLLLNHPAQADCALLAEPPTPGDAEGHLC